MGCGTTTCNTSTLDVLERADVGNVVTVTPQTASTLSELLLVF